MKYPSSVYLIPKYLMKGMKEIPTHHIRRSLTNNSLLSDLLRPEAVLAVLRLVPAVLGDVPQSDHLLGGADWNGDVLTDPAWFLSDSLQ